MATPIKKPVILLVADGWGVAPDGPGNYITQAKTPIMDGLKKDYPYTTNLASGNAVGLPEGSQGNSEVGHLHMGAGRVVWQMYELINRAIRSGEFDKNEALRKAMLTVKESGDLHLVGLCSDEGVHAHTDHLLALLEMAKKLAIPRVFVHFIADGRDVSEKSAQKYVDLIEQAGGQIATIVGRYYALDRARYWDRTEAAYNLLVKAEGFTAQTATAAIDAAYERGDITDYYIKPTVIVDDQGQPRTTVKDGDSLIFFNFRTDRPRQLSYALTDADFDEFPRPIWPKINFVPMTPYDPKYDSIAAFHEAKIVDNLGFTLAQASLKQLRIAEKEKAAHVTFFFNSQHEEAYPGEDRLIVPTLDVPVFDVAPQMSAPEIADQAVKQIAAKKYDFILINFANCDVVGHTTVKEAIIKAVETVDGCVGQVVTAGLAAGYDIVVTADHGSAEEKLYPDGTPRPAHSCNPVPFIIVSDDSTAKSVTLRSGEQSDVAPTILELMGLAKAEGMTGKSLITTSNA